MLVTGSPSPENTRRGAPTASRVSMGFLKTPQHQKVPSPLTESLTERFTTIIDNCQKKIKLFQGPSTLFNTLVTKARRKDRDCPLSQDQESKLYLEKEVLDRNVPETDLRQLVELPPGLGYEEWLASHTIDFFHHINLIYGTVCEFCTLTGCPDMVGPAMRHYLWQDEKGKKSRVAAPQYVDYVMTFIQNTVNDESIFPTKFENEFPSCFETVVKKIHRLLFHVVAHLYHSHFRELVLLSLNSHLNCIFAHFVLFNEKFKLVDEKETEILHDLILALKLSSENKNSTSTTTSCTSTTTQSILISSATSTSSNILTNNPLPAVSCSDDGLSQEPLACAEALSNSPINNNCNSPSSTLHYTNREVDRDPLVNAFSPSMEEDSMVSTVTATVTQVTAVTGVHRPPLISTGVSLADTRP